MKATGPDLSAREVFDLSGQPSTVQSLCKDFENNLLIVWQPNCPPCKSEIEAIKGMTWEANVQIITVGFGEAEDLADTAAAWAIPWPVFRGDQDFYDGIEDETTSTPALFLLDNTGKAKGKSFKADSNEADSIEDDICRWFEDLE